MKQLTWKKRLFSSLWMNNVFFAGMGIIGLFFVAIQYAAQAGWSVGVKRIGIAMGTWIPIAGVLMLILWFVTNHDIFHWTHNYLYHEGKAAQFDHRSSIKKLLSFSGHWPAEHSPYSLFSEWFVLRSMVLVLHHDPQEHGC